MDLDSSSDAKGPANQKQKMLSTQLMMPTQNEGGPRAANQLYSSQLTQNNRQQEKNSLGLSGQNTMVNKMKPNMREQERRRSQYFGKTSSLSLNYNSALSPTAKPDNLSVVNPRDLFKRENSIRSLNSSRSIIQEIKRQGSTYSKKSTSRKPSIRRSNTILRNEVEDLKASGARNLQGFVEKFKKAAENKQKV